MNTQNNTMRTLYVANPEYHEEVYAPQPVICYDPPMIREIAAMWEVPIEEYLQKFHRASPEEVAEYGSYPKIVDWPTYEVISHAAIHTVDRESYIEEYARHAVWEDFDGDPIAQVRLDYLGWLWEIAHALPCDLLECLDMTRDEFRDCYPIADDELDQLLHGTMPLPDSEMEWILEMVYPAISLPRQ
jgi:hypothetical protein